MKAQIPKRLGMRTSEHIHRLDRRKFLKRTLLTGAGLAIPTIVPARVLGRDGMKAPSERIVFAGIGLGPRGQYDLSVMLPERDVQFVAVCDVRRARREQIKSMADEHYGNGDCVMYRDFRELIARPDIDAVLIATGDHWHALASLLAAKAGKDVYSEKPCGLTIGEIQALADGIHRYGRPRFTFPRRTTTGCPETLSRPARNAIGTCGSGRRRGAPITADMCRAAGGATTISKRPEISPIGGHIRSISANGPTKPTTPCPSSTKPLPIPSLPATPTA